MSVDTLYLPTENFSMQQNINDVVQWTAENKMLINGSKTKYMIFNRTINHQFNTRLHLSDTILEPITEMKLVGVWITSDLSWAKNTSEICRKAFARLSLITKLMYVGVGTEQLISIYIIFI